MRPSQTPPDLSALEPDRIRGLSFPDLAAAACAALDTLRDGSGGVEGAIELLETAEADALYEALWQVHLIPFVRKVPNPNPYEKNETHEVQEALVGALREYAGRRPGNPEPFYALLNGLGDQAALDLANRVDAWRHRYPTPI